MNAYFVNVFGQGYSLWVERPLHPFPEQGDAYGYAMRTRNATWMIVTVQTQYAFPQFRAPPSVLMKRRIKHQFKQKPMFQTLREVAK